jgi:hypothetical protein
MASQISMVAAEYQVRAITGDEFIVIYTRGSATVKACLARFLRMFNSSRDEWVAGLDVEYTTVLEREKILKEAEKKKPAMIQVCVHNVCLVYHICHADVECQDFKNFLKDERGTRTKSRTWTRTPSRWQCRRSCWFYCSVKRTSCLVYFQGCVVLRPQQNYVYVLSRYLNSLVRTVVLVLCLTTVLLAVGTTARIFVFLLYLIRSY